MVVLHISFELVRATAYGKAVATLTSNSALIDELKLINMCEKEAF